MPSPQVAYNETSQMCIGKETEMKNDAIEVPPLLTQLAEGFSKQNKVSASYWIALALVAIVTVIPNPVMGDIKFPLLPSIEMPAADFYPFACILISLLTVGYGSATSQVTRTRRLVDKYLKSKQMWSKEYLVPSTIHIQDVFDAVTTASINRVAPLAQILQGKKQFFPEANDRSTIVSILSSAYFILLRAVGALAIEIFPGYALTTSIIKGKLLENISKPWGLPSQLFLVVAFVAYIIMFQLLVIDFLTGRRAVLRINAKKLSPEK